MNIFITSCIPEIAAREMCDQHLTSKMLLESVQMLSTCFRSLLVDKQEEMDDWGIYQSAYPHHPCNVWLRESRWNVYWLIRHAIEIERIRLQAGLNPHESAKVLRDLLVFRGNHELELQTRYTCKGKDDFTNPFLAMDSSLQNIYGVLDNPEKKKREKGRWRANTWGHAEQAYQSFVPSKVFKDGSVPTWTINGNPEWLKRVTQ